VETYGFQATDIIQSQLDESSNAELLQQFATGAGMEKKLAYLKKLDLVGVERNLIESLDTSRTFFPADILSQPFGHGTKSYSFQDSVHMIYDLEPFSTFSELRDPLNLITQKPNHG
jgi:hypothetical protein